MSRTESHAPARVALLKRCAAEAAGTFSLVLVGPGAAVFAEATGMISHLGVSLAFGAVVFAMVLWLGRFSGAHINPAVTLGLAARRQFNRADVLPYVTAQLVGAVAAAGVLRSAFPAAIGAAATAPQFGLSSAVATEFLLSFALMAVILRVSGAPPLRAALAIGGTIAAEAFLGGPITGASMNPARSFGPALASGVWSAHWVYWVAPLAGALVASSLRSRSTSRAMAAHT